LEPPFGGGGPRCCACLRRRSRTRCTRVHCPWRAERGGHGEQPEATAGGGGVHEALASLSGGGSRAPTAGTTPVPGSRNQGSRNCVKGPPGGPNRLVLVSPSRGPNFPSAPRSRGSPDRSKSPSAPGRFLHHCPAVSPFQRLSSVLCYWAAGMP
jgi:hypothetical protein